MSLFLNDRETLIRYFTDEELLKESRPLADLALEALDAGQVQRLHYLLNEMEQGHAGLCALGLQWMTRMWGKIRADFGEDVLDGMLGKSGAYLQVGLDVGPSSLRL